MKCVHVVGARPNFMKAAPVLSALNCIPGVIQRLVHTGQHYDSNMSKIFFSQLGIVEPDINLKVGSASQAVQTATVMIRLEEYLLKEAPDLVLVYGDVNSTVAAALVCSKMRIPIGHVEAGLRSCDRSMPEEINRILTDQISDFLFTPSVDGNENLIREGISSRKIHFVGNVMIDTLIKLLPQAESIWKNLSRKLKLEVNSYGLVTLHRPSNVDNPEVLRRIMEALQSMSKQIPLLFPMHPRTFRNLRRFTLEEQKANINVMEPMGYLEFLALQKNAVLVVTDSGGIQEESTFLGIPCLTLRENTERPITVNEGTNYLIGMDLDRLQSVFHDILYGKDRKGSIPLLWDGRSALRIAQIIADFFNLDEREQTPQK